MTTGPRHRTRQQHDEIAHYLRTAFLSSFTKVASISVAIILIVMDNPSQSEIVFFLILDYHIAFTYGKFFCKIKTYNSRRE